MIIILLGLCRYVDGLSPEQEENTQAQNNNKAVSPIEYNEIELEVLRHDTVYYTLENTKKINIYNTVN